MLIALVGAWDSPHVSEVLAQLKREASHDVVSLPGLAALRQDGVGDPALIVVYQSVPHEFAPADIDELIGRFPLSRWLVVFGPWCESLARTEPFWPVGWLVPLRSAVPRIALELRALSQGEPPVPGTASRDETFARQAARSERFRRSDSVAPSPEVLLTGDDSAWAICTRDTLLSQGFAARVSPWGETPASDPPPSGLADAPSGTHPALIVLLLSLLDEPRRRQVRAWRARAPHARLIVASDLLTPADVRTLQADGVDHVVTALRFADEFAEAVCAAQSLRD